MQIIINTIALSLVKKEKYFVAKSILFGGLLAMVITGLVFLGIMYYIF